MILDNYEIKKEGEDMVCISDRYSNHKKDVLSISIGDFESMISALFGVDKIKRTYEDGISYTMDWKKD